LLYYHALKQNASFFLKFFQKFLKKTKWVERTERRILESKKGGGIILRSSLLVLGKIVINKNLCEINWVLATEAESPWGKGVICQNILDKLNVLL
jgi:hypothetical protein